MGLLITNVTINNFGHVIITYHHMTQYYDMRRVDM